MTGIAGFGFDSPPLCGGLFDCRKDVGFLVRRAPDFGTPTYRDLLSADDGTARVTTYKDKMSKPRPLGDRFAAGDFDLQDYQLDVGRYILHVGKP